MDTEKLTPEPWARHHGYTIEKARVLIDEELARATAKFGPFRTPEEGWAVLEEEIDELWEAIKSKEDAYADGLYGRNCAIVGEAAQVGAMALRYLRDSAPAWPWPPHRAYYRPLTSLHDAYGIIRRFPSAFSDEARAESIHSIALSILTDLCYDI